MSHEGETEKDKARDSVREHLRFKNKFKQIDRGMDFELYEITDTKYLHEVDDKIKSDKAKAMNKGVTTWTRIKEGSVPWSKEGWVPCTLDGRYDDKCALANDNSDHLVKSGIVGFKIMKGGGAVTYVDSKTDEPKVTERMYFVTQKGQTVELDQSSFKNREIKLSKGRKDESSTKYDRLNIIERYSLSTYEGQVDVDVTRELPEGMPENHMIKPSKGSLDSIKYLIFTWEFVPGREADKLEIATATKEGTKFLPLKDDFDDVEKNPSNYRDYLSFKALSNGKLILGEFVKKNANFLESIKASRSKVEVKYRIEGQDLKYFETWETNNPEEDGWVTNADNQRHGSAWSSCLAGNDILVEAPDPANIKRAYFEFNTSGLSSSPTFRVKEVRLILDVANGGGNNNCRFVPLPTVPTSTACPGGGNTVYNQMTGAPPPTYRNTTIPTGTYVSRVLGDRSPLTPSISDAACIDVQNSVTGVGGNPPTYRFAVGIRKTDESVAGYNVNVRGEEWDTGASPKPTLWILYDP